MNILFASSEVYPLIQTGGLADVSYSLPRVLKILHQSVRVLLPAYETVLKAIDHYRPLTSFSLNDKTVQVFETEIPPSRLKVWLINYPDYFKRSGNPYIDEKGQDWPDNAMRFGFFCQAAVLVAMNQVGLKWQADIVHCNDWQTGLIPVYLTLTHEKNKPKTVFTIHNLAYQGLFPYDTLQKLALPENLWSYEALEYYGQFSFIKGGLVFADKLTTVSLHYATEITTSKFGCGLEGLLNYRRQDLTGIINGIDDNEWNPAKDPYLSTTYSHKSLEKKVNNKRALQVECGLHNTQQPLPQSMIEPLLIGIVSRLSHQKGIDVLLDTLPTLLELPIQIVLLGSGNKNDETRLLDYAKHYSGQFHVSLGYNKALAHRIIAGADLFLMPSRYEPCGLTQLYSLAYGTLPLVHSVGGLVDTVTTATEETIKNKTATGFSFNEMTADVIYQSTKQILFYYQQSSLWKQLQINGMKQNFSWKKSARQYLQLYHTL